LLAIPAIALVYYFKKYKPTIMGSILTLFISFVILIFVMYGIIQGLISISSSFELLFVNSFGMPYNSGFMFFIVILIAGIIALLYFTKKKAKPVIHTALLSFLVLIIGYSSFAMIVIRSNANPPIDENDPENTFALKSYLNREQYGDRPLIYGQYYDAEAIESIDQYTYISDFKNTDGKDKYVKVKKTNPKYIFDPNRQTILPRMHSSSSDHIEAYQTWGNVTGTPTFANNITFFVSYQVFFMYLRYFAWNFIGRQNDTQTHGSGLNGGGLSGIKFIDNVITPQDNLPDKMKNEESRNTYFFLPLLLGLLGIFFHASKEKYSFWVVLTFFILTGLAIVVYLNQTPYQPRERDYAYAGSFYAFTIWIGLSVVGAFYYLSKIKQIKNDLLRSVAPTVLFLLIPILMAAQNWDDHDRSKRYHTVDFASNYLNSCAQNAILFTFGDNDTFPLWYAQEVEGIRTDVRNVNISLFSTDWYANQMKRKAYESEPLPLSIDLSKYVVGTRDIIFVKENPNVLFTEKYEANKSEFKAEYDSLYNEMLSVLKNSTFSTVYPADYTKIITGPDALGVQQFVAFVNNLSSGATKLNIDKNSIKILTDKVTSFAQKIADAYAPIDAVMKFVLSDDKNTKLGYGDEMVDYIPTKKILIPVDKSKIIEMGFVQEDKQNKIENVKFVINNQYLLKAQWLTLQIIAENQWERPIYFATSIGNENYLGLTNYFRLEGFAYRLVPYKIPKNEQGEIGEINTDILYDNLITKFKWGNISSPDYYVDHFVERTVAVMGIREVFYRLANELLKEGKNDKALTVLDKCIEVLPDNKIEYSYDMIPFVDSYFALGEFEKGNQIANIIFDNFAQQIKYFEGYKGEKAKNIERDQTIAVYVLQQLYSIALDYEQKELEDKVTPLLQANIGKVNLNM
jgi:predicted membrane channel-forming protein YqfA (hemolysin III family)